jgi:hypothetical protein
MLLLLLQAGSRAVRVRTVKTWELDLLRHSFLTSALDGGEWSKSRTGRFTAGGEAPVPIE